MKFRFRKIWLVLALLVHTQIHTYAIIKLPKFVSDNMVLQRDIRIPVWGWADKDEKVTVRFFNKTYASLTDSSGKWMVYLDPIKAGGPYEIVISGKNQVVLKNILIGDVWICSGQSNMAWSVESSWSQNESEISKANNPEIRFLQIGSTASETPQKDVNSSGWKVCTPETVRKFSAVGYFFGKGIYNKIQIPIGLISDNVGGSSIEAWMSPEALKNYPKYQEEYQAFKTFKEATASQLAIWETKADSLNNTSLYDTTWAQSKADESWRPIDMPMIWDYIGIDKFIGVIWLKKEVNIPTEMAGKDLSLFIPNIEDDDITWFNGKKIGQTKGSSSQRKYTIPGNLVTAGVNYISIRVANYSGLGGINHDLHHFKLESKASLNSSDEWQYKLALQSKWKYKMSVNFGSFPEKPSIKALPKWEFHLPQTTYNGMIAPIMGYGIKGAIWYQGETNIYEAYDYRNLLSNLINDWRAKWQLGNFPFLVVQLPNYKIPKLNPESSDWAEFRESQSKVLSLPNTGMAVAIDLGEMNDIHPLNKQDVGNRIALVGLKVAYNQKNIVFSGPTYETMKIEENKIRISFKNTGSGLISKNGELKEFAIAGSDQKFYWAKAKIEGNTIVVESENVPNPVAVRYAWADNPDKANLYNKENLPASSFRTDDWKLLTQP